MVWVVGLLLWVCFVFAVCWFYVYWFEVVGVSLRLCVFDLFVSLTLVLFIGGSSWFAWFCFDSLLVFGLVGLCLIDCVYVELCVLIGSLFYLVAFCLDLLCYLQLGVVVFIWFVLFLLIGLFCYVYWFAC